MSFLQAVEDYRYLKSHGYPDKAALKLVSDRYRLSSLARNCLFRAVFPADDCQLRRSKLIGAEELKSRALGVDWYNVLITLESYLKGFPVFLADDGLVRDSAGVHGSFRIGRVTERATGEILTAIAAVGPQSVQLFLDSPISFSGDMAERLRDQVAERLPVPCSVSLSPSADYPLKSFSGVVATSDSTVINSAGVHRVFDLAHYIIEGRFRCPVPSLEDLAEKLSPPGR